MKVRKIWVDADACPKAVKEVLYRAADRTGIPLTLVANQVLEIPGSRHIDMIQVAAGYDVADNYIVKKSQTDDLVITADIPLAAEVIEKGCKALSPRGELFTENNIRQRLNMRDFMDSLRSSGVEPGGGPPSFSNTDCRNFANQLDRLLAGVNR